MAETLTLGEVIRTAIETHLSEVHVSLIGRIESYNAETNRATVKLELQHYVSDGEGGYVPEDYPVLPEVPIAFPQGGGFCITFPLAKGDPVLVVFADVPIGAWISKGEKTESGIVEWHGLGGAVAYPGLQPKKSPIADASTTSMVLGKDGTAAAQIEITGSQVKLGGGAEFVALANKVQAWFDAFNAAVSGWSPVAQDGGAALKTALGSLYSGTPTTDVGASNVKAT